jgi:hypothetical protein
MYMNPFFLSCTAESSSGSLGALAKMKADAKRKAVQGNESSMLIVVIVALISIYCTYTQMS